MPLTFSQMRFSVCSELGLYDDASLQLCGFFLNKEYVTLWDKYPWGDATGHSPLLVPAGTSTVQYPVGMDRIITLRASTGPTSDPPFLPEDPDAPVGAPTSELNSYFLDPVDSTFLTESEPLIFEQHGRIKYYEEVGDATNRVIRLYPIPSWGTTLRFFGKMICHGFVNDDDISLLRNLDPAIMAYAYFDMLQRQRQYGKADIKRKEAQELEAVAWNLEKQQANQPRRTKATTVAGNSLAEMVDAVCQICGQWTPEYRQIIREFLRRDYQALYDFYLWPESLVTVLMPYANERLILPYYIDRVIALRSPGKFRMMAADAALLFDLNPTVFEETGDPISYTTLTPVAVSVLPSTTTQLVLASNSDLDITDVAIRGEVIATGQEFEETVTLQGKTPVMTVYSYDVPLTVAKDITIGDVSINAANDYTALGQLRWYIREKKHQSLWLLPPLSDADNDGSKHLLVMGKRLITPLVSDQDTPIITGAQQILIAAAAADVFRKLEKPDQATAFQQKASTSTEVLKAKNTDQAASSPRFVPQIEPRAYVSGGVGGCSW